MFVVIAFVALVVVALVFVVSLLCRYCSRKK